MPGKPWTDATERQLFLTIIAIASPTIPTPVWEQLAAQLGEGHTASAVKQKFDRLKKAAQQEMAGGAATAAATPKGKKTAGEAGKKASAGKRKASVAAADGEDDEEGEVDSKMDEESPSKKTKVKAEAGDEEEGDLIFD